MSVTHSRKKRRMDTTGYFDLVVVGCGGGHDETNISGYLFKPKNQPWSAGVLGLEAGSGYGALKRLLSTTHPHLFSSIRPTSKPASLDKPTELSPMDKAYAVYANLRAYLLTHAHLDHAASLIISSGSLPGPTKYILGARGVLEDLQRCIWGPGRCWPEIVGWEDNPSVPGPEDNAVTSANTSGGILRALPVAPSKPDEAPTDRDSEYTAIGLGIENVLVRAVPVSHGCGPSHSHPEISPKGASPANDEHSDSPGVYKSSAFFIRHAQTQHEFLFFGDVEADPVSPSPSRPLLRPIWQHTAHLFTARHLHTLLIECSYPAGRPEAQLFGHLSVEGLRREMRTLATEVVKLRSKDKRVLKEVPIEAQPSTNPVPSPRRSRRMKPTHSDSLRLAKGSKRKAASISDSAPSLVPNTDPLHGALTGLRVIVIHCKDPAPGFDFAGAPTIEDFIVRQLKEGVKGVLGPNELGIEYVAAHQGDEFVL